MYSTDFGPETRLRTAYAAAAASTELCASYFPTTAELFAAFYGSVVACPTGATQNSTIEYSIPAH